MSKKRQRVQPRPSPSRPRPKVGRQRQPDWLMPVGISILGLVLLAALVVGIVVLFSRGTPPSSSSGVGRTIDGVQCQTSEQAVYHIHAHLAIFANGQPRTVPLGIGIPNPQTDSSGGSPFAVSGTCFYWLHSHDTTGIMHVESPDQRVYTLGNWFDIWGEKLNASQVGSDTGTVTAYVNGQPYTGDPRQIPLTAHAVIQLDVGIGVAPKPYTFPSGL
jgi:hypothetical protein